MNLDGYYQQLSSERLTFRKLTLADAEEWQDFYKDNPSLDYLNINTNRPIRVMAESWIQSQLERYETNQFGQLAMILKSTGELVGTRGFRVMSIDDSEAELVSMCSIRKPYWRQGYGTEGVGAFYDYVFDHNLANQIYALTHPDNNRSRKYLESLGFKLIDNQLIEDRMTCVFKLKKENWRIS